MKKSSGALAGLLAVCFAIGATVHSCRKIPIEAGQGSLSWNFGERLVTKSATDIPDTDAFILTVKTAAGAVLYDGKYGDSPVELSLDPGTYSVKAVSRIFTEPAFNAPQFGDEQVVVVNEGARTHVRLECRQLNSGLILRSTENFRQQYPGGHFSVTSQEGSLKYLADESRIGYFNSGNVKISLVEGGETTSLTTRYLEPCEILSLGISCPAGKDESNGTSLSISVDTTRNWITENYQIGDEDGDSSGSSIATAFGITQAKENIGAKDVWICGYIVGGDMTSSNSGISFEAPFSSATHIAIAARSSVVDKSSCMSVQLPKGDIRTGLNLVDNPSLLGVKVCIRGDIVESYYGIPGIQNVTEYMFMT